MQSLARCQKFEVRRYDRRIASDKILSLENNGNHYISSETLNFLAKLIYFDHVEHRPSFNTTGNKSRAHGFQTVDLNS